MARFASVLAILLTVPCLLGPSPLAPSLFALETITYEPMVEILRVQAIKAPGGKGYNLEVTFNLIPDLPKGIKVEFDLQRDGVSTEDRFRFVLENENRKNIKQTWVPKNKLTIDKYNFMTQIHLDDQTPEVRKIIESKPKRFPPEHNPWAWSHDKQSFDVGTPEDAKAEQAEFVEYVRGLLEKLVELNNSGVEEMEKRQTGKLDVDAFKKALTEWMGEMAKVQEEVATFPEREPGLYAKNLKVHLELQGLGRMVAKRITNTDLKALLKKQSLPATAVRLPTTRGFDPNFQYAANAKSIKDKIDAIEKLLDPEAAEEEVEGEGDEAPAADGADSKTAKDKDKDKEKDKDTEPKPEKPKTDEKPKADKSGKKASSSGAKKK